jgi:recombination protein RecT
MSTAVARKDVKATRYELAIMAVKQRFLQLATPEVWAREVNFAYQAFRKSKNLQACTQESIQDAVMNIALTGATLNPVMKQASLIPRKNVCCLDFQYRGLIKLATQKGAVVDMDAEVVYEADYFLWEKGLDPKLVHKPHLSGNRGKATHVYGIAILPSGIKKFVVMDVGEVEEIRKMSKAPNSPMWEDFYGEACKKTVIKRLYKYLPQTEQLSTAIDIVNREEGIDFAEQEKKNSHARSLEQHFIGEPDVKEEQPPETEHSHEEQASDPTAEDITDVEGSISADQVKKIKTLFTILKTPQREKQLMEINTILVKDRNNMIESTKQLSSREAHIVIEKLEMIAPKGDK